MKAQIHYRLAISQDMKALIEIGEQLFDGPVKIERCKEFLADPRHHLMLAFKDKAIVGMASGFVYLHPDKDPILFINEVAVLEEWQNQGIGRRLVCKLGLHGNELGLKEAWLATELSNHSARKAFTAANGKEEEHAVAIHYNLPELAHLEINKSD